MQTLSLSAARTQFHSEIIRAGLQDYFVGGLVNLAGASWRIVFIRNGAAQIVTGTDPQWISSPTLILQPVTSDVRVRIRAGSLGAHLLLGEQGLSNAIGRKPEAAELRMMASQPVHMPLADPAHAESDVATAFDVILREGEAQAPGSETIIEAQVRVLLVHLWRYVTKVDELSAAIASSSQVLQEFRQLLEVHFKERRSVKDYAAALRVSPDRLHDICARSLNKPPLRLIHERTIYEAQSLLARSNRTVDQISDFLGFKSAGQFNKFFKRFVGVPPGEFRRIQHLEAQSDEAKYNVSFADWP